MYPKAIAGGALPATGLIFGLALLRLVPRRQS
jgi:hypothetical protein